MGAASSVAAPRLQSTTSVRHNNLPPWASNSYLFLMLITVFVIMPILILLTIWGTSRSIFGSGVHNVVICLLPLWTVAVFAGKTLNSVAKYSRTMETGKNSIRDSSAYADGQLMEQAIKTSPYRHLLSKTGQQETSESMPLAISRNVMYFQPVEGYCAYATLNTALNSLPSPMALPFTRFPKPLDIDELCDLIETSGDGLFDAVKPVTMSDRTKFEDFRRHVMEANKDQCRVLVNFHRKPLFAPQRTTNWWQSLIAALGGHWSPLGGVVSKEMRDGSTEEYVLVLDVNRKYGPYMVKMERFFEAVKTKSSPLSGEEGYRGW